MADPEPHPDVHASMQDVLETMGSSGVPHDDDGLARPVDATARYGAGQGHTLVLGGGGTYFVAWQVTYLATLAELGVDWGLAETVVGTSAGSIVAAAVTSGRLPRLATEASWLAKVPGAAGAIAPASNLHPSQQRALTMFAAAGDAHPDTVRPIGHAALAAQTPSARAMRRRLRMLLGTGTWPSESLTITATDAYTGERVVVTSAAKVTPARACAASSAVPGLFSPQSVGDRTCMDGGVAGSGTHTDLVAGAARVVVVALSDGTTIPAPTMTLRPSSFAEEMAAVRAQGTEVLELVADPVSPADLMDPQKIPAAVASGAARARHDAEVVRAFWRP